MIPEIFSKVLNMSMTASLVIGIVIAARFALRKSPKIFSYALWAVVLFRLLCPVSIPSPLSAFGFLDAGTAPNEGITTSIEYVEVYREVIEQPQPPAELPELPEMAEQVHTPNAETPKEPLSLKAVLPWLWLAGVVGMMLFGIVTYVRFRVHLTGAVPMERNVYLVDHIDSAFVAGVLRPRIYLPSDLPETEMSYILEHEKYHLRRLDHVAKHLAFLALSIHWFNPLVWVAFILSGKDMEMSCDEAVIQKLGEGIRADYSVSLLNLATGRKIIAGSPLAFGEGDTKGRVLNMARWKQPKKWVRILSFVLCIAILTACAANPDREVVISKNDGALESNIQQTAPNDPLGETSQEILYSDEFTSTDGSIEYTLNIGQTMSSSAMPVVEVVPHKFTSEDVKRIANTLFEGADIYEREPTKGWKLSKEQIQNMIARWSQYTNITAMAELLMMDSTDENVAAEVDYLKRQIEWYTEKLETAPVENSLTPCDWTFKKQSHYNNWEAEMLDEPDPNEPDVIYATVKLDDIEYCFAAETRDEADYKINTFDVTLSSGMGPDIDLMIYRAMLCRTAKPTDEQIRSISQKAQQMLDKMELGEWVITDTYVQTTVYNDIAEYTVEVEAVPVFNGASAIYGQATPAATAEDVYSAYYPVSRVLFGFSPNGEIIHFRFQSPVDVKEVKNTNVQTLSLDELMEIAKNNLILRDAHSGWGVSSDMIYMYEEVLGEMVCKIEITGFTYGLARINVANSDSYYYVPAIVFKGTSEYVGKDTGTVHLSSSDYYNGDFNLIWINAIDGSIIFH